ncbi:hypothetical protein BJA5080_06311 [Bradyrhizobium diazoefficiens SEMIA 5080]|uniref:Uncharacterized protein n=1 Tax=Bradyrhizobium diazoefficiens SEMIA 5080 TaxID=754504 RepID=A0A837CNW5_9BRAD|nr:hypothetical protein BJA5080_06311 [Bradyrhizobium diazoefficiens SEMIA 5080]
MKMLASRHGAIALLLRLASETRNGSAATDICRTPISGDRSRPKLQKRLQKPQTLTARGRLPRRLSTMRSPPFSAELP